MKYKSGDFNQMVEITKEKINSLRADYLLAKDKDDQEAMEQIVTEGKRWRSALDVMERVISIKEAKDTDRFDKDVEEVFGL